MLVLSRKLNQNILIGDHIVVKVLKLGLESIRLGVEAPTEIPVHRQEVYDEIRQSNQHAIAQSEQVLPKVQPKTRRRREAAAFGHSAPTPVEATTTTANV